MDLDGKAAAEKRKAALQQLLAADLSQLSPDLAAAAREASDSPLAPFSPPQFAASSLPMDLDEAHDNGKQASTEKGEAALPQLFAVNLSQLSADLAAAACHTSKHLRSSLAPFSPVSPPSLPDLAGPAFNADNIQSQNDLLYSPLPQTSAASKISPRGLPSTTAEGAKGRKRKREVEEDCGGGGVQGGKKVHDFSNHDEEKIK